MPDLPPRLPPLPNMDHDLSTDDSDYETVSHPSHDNSDDEVPADDSASNVSFIEEEDEEHDMPAMRRQSDATEPEEDSEISITPNLASTMVEGQLASPSLVNSRIRFPNSSTSPQTSVSFLKAHLPVGDLTESVSEPKHLMIESTIPLKSMLASSLHLGPSEARLQISRPFRILYNGNEDVKDDILTKIGQAIWVSQRPNQSSPGWDKYTIVETTDEQGTPDVDVFPASNLEISVFDSANYEFEGGGFNFGFFVEPLRDSTSAPHLKPTLLKWPDLVVIVHDLQDDFLIERNRESQAHQFEENGVPVISLFMAAGMTKSGTGEAAGEDLTPRAPFQRSSGTTSGSSLLAPLDVQSFLLVDDRALNSHLARLTGMHEVEPIHGSLLLGLLWKQHMTFILGFMTILTRVCNGLLDRMQFFRSKYHDLRCRLLSSMPLPLQSFRRDNCPSTSLIRFLLLTSMFYAIIRFYNAGAFTQGQVTQMIPLGVERMNEIVGRHLPVFHQQLHDTSVYPDLPSTAPSVWSSTLVKTATGVTDNIKSIKHKSVSTPVKAATPAMELPTSKTTSNLTTGDEKQGWFNLLLQQFSRQKSVGASSRKPEPATSDAAVPRPEDLVDSPTKQRSKVQDAAKALNKALGKIHYSHLMEMLRAKKVVKSRKQDAHPDKHVLLEASPTYSSPLSIWMKRAQTSRKTVVSQLQTYYDIVASRLGQKAAASGRAMHDSLENAGKECHAYMESARSGLQAVQAKAADTLSNPPKLPASAKRAKDRAHAIKDKLGKERRSAEAEKADGLHVKAEVIEEKTFAKVEHANKAGAESWKMQAFQKKNKKSAAADKRQVGK